MTGRNIAVPGDTLSVWTDARTRQTRKMAVSTSYQGDMVVVTATFEPLNSGLTYMAYAEVTVTAKQTRVRVRPRWSLANWSSVIWSTCRTLDRGNVL